MSPVTIAARIDVREIAPSGQAAVIIAAFRDLHLGKAVEIICDHDPKELYHRFRVEAPGDFGWTYLHSGPDVWRVSVQKLGRAHGAGECCGVCGGAS